MKSLMPQIDSNDGLFHNGNPATGEQGTRVTDTWLNNLQDRVRDVQAEAHYVLQKAGFQPVENKQTQLYEAIVKIIDDNRKTASLTQKGEVQLSSSTNSNSETQAATSKAVKVAYDLANSKQSPATTLAGYGIGNFKIENFAGDVNTLQTDGIYAVTQASRSQNLPVAGNGCHIQVIAGGDGRWCRQIAYIAYSTDMYERHQTSYQTDSWSPWVKIDSLDKIPNSKKSSAVNSESEDNVATSKAAKTAYDKAVEAKTAADNANNNANGRVSKDGDNIKWLNVIRDHAWLVIKSTKNGSAGLDFAVQGANYPQVSLEAFDVGEFAEELRIHTTPKGSNYDSDRRNHVMTVAHDGNVWVKPYGWLHDHFAKQADINNVWNELNNTYRKNRFRHQYYPNHYGGAEVFDVPMGDNGVMRTIVMGATIDGYAKLNLPESFTGNCRVQVMDVGNGRHAVGANIQNGNVVEVFNYGHTGLNIIATGWYGW